MDRQRCLGAGIGVVGLLLPLHALSAPAGTAVLGCGPRCQEAVTVAVDQAARRFSLFLVGLLEGCDTVVVDVEPVQVMLESSTVGGAQTPVKGCGDEELGLKGVGPVWIGLRRFDHGWQWVCEDVGEDGGPETLLGLEQRLATVSFESVEPGGEWDVWIVGYLKGTLCDVPKNQFGRLCGHSVRFVMPPPGNRVTLPVSCVPGLVTDKHKVIEAAVKDCFERLFPP